MDKKGLSHFERVGFGSVLAFGGIILMSFGAVMPNDWMLRIGVFLTTSGGWLITWK